MKKYVWTMWLCVRSRGRRSRWRFAPGTPFEDIPDDWVCPICGLGKDVFEELSE